MNRAGHQNPTKYYQGEINQFNVVKYTSFRDIQISTTTKKATVMRVVGSISITVMNNTNHLDHWSEQNICVTLTPPFPWTTDNIWRPYTKYRHIFKSPKDIIATLSGRCRSTAKRNQSIWRIERLIRKTSCPRNITVFRFSKPANSYIVSKLP